jgi:hypothetical protein
MDLDVQA